MKKTILCVIGTRPEAVKMSPVIHALRKHPHFVVHVCVTGQHRQLLDPILDLFHIIPDTDLAVMQPNQTLSGLTASLLLALDPLVAQLKPDWILAQGDTTTVLVAGLVAHYHHCKFGHIEAGLRTGDKYSPFPEEMNRRIADILADAYFAPTTRAQQMLIHEGILPQAIFITGNTVIDALLDVANRPYVWQSSPLAWLDPTQTMVLMTLHRRESFGQTLADICHVIKRLANDLPLVQFVYPVHLNPNVQTPVKAILGNVPNIHLIAPLDYPHFVHAMKRASLIITDSGGVQEEAPSLGVPVLVLRDTTERPEGIEAGVVKLIGTQPEAIYTQTYRLLTDETARLELVKSVNPYGDGQASTRIVKILDEWKTS